MIARKGNGRVGFERNAVRVCPEKGTIINKIKINTNWLFKQRRTEEAIMEVTDELVSVFRLREKWQ